MNCEQIRALLDSYLDNTLPPESRQEVDRHIQTCPQCAALFAGAARARSHLRDAVLATPLPPGMETRVLAAVRGERSRPRTGLWAVAAAAAIVAVVFLIGVLRKPVSPEDAILRKTSGPYAAIFNVGLLDHLNCAFFRKYPKVPAPSAQLVADLGSSFGDLLPAVQSHLPAGFFIVEAHHCAVRGRAYTHFIISDGAKLASLILTRPRHGEWLNDGLYQTGVDRFQIVGFESHDYLAYLVSDLEPQQSLQWAANLAPAVRQYLADNAG